MIKIVRQRRETDYNKNIKILLLLLPSYQLIEPMPIRPKEQKELKGYK